MFAANGLFSDEVETNFAAVWKADESWTRSLLAGEVKPPEPEIPEEPEAVMEVEAETAEEPEAPAEPEVENAAELTVDETKQTKVLSPEPFVQSMAVQEPLAAEEPAPFQQPPMMEVINKENATNIFEDAVKMPFAKQLGAQSPTLISAAEGLAPKDVNAQPIDVQPMEFA